jgi:hypothetical protein
MSLPDANGYTRLQTTSVREVTVSSPDNDKKEKEEVVLQRPTKDPGLHASVNGGSVKTFFAPPE